MGNCNGGLYLIPAPLLPVLAPAWETWARWLLDRRGLLRDWTFHLDQVAMVLALAAEGSAPSNSTSDGTPPSTIRPGCLRIPPSPPSSTITRRSIPTAVSAHRLSVDRPADRAGERFHRPTVAQAFPTVTFWQWRHLTELERRSRDGTREFPRRDAAAGDGRPRRCRARLCPRCRWRLTTRRPAPCRLRTSSRSDASVEAFGAARRTARLAVRADLVVCLDVVIHEPDAAAYGPKWSGRGSPPNERS